MSSPTISVVMPVFNGDRYLHESISSILNQTYREFELIIVNDGSTDNSEEIIQSFNDSRILYLKFNHNLGIPQALNFGVKNAQGYYIARADSDDILFPWRLEKQLELHENNSKIDFSDSLMINFREKFVFTKKHLVKPQSKVHNSFPQNWQSKQDLLWDTCINHPTLFCKAAILKENPYPNIIYAEDYLLWIKLIFKYKYLRLNLPTVAYRLHPSQSLNKLKEREDFLKNQIKRPYIKIFFDVKMDNSFYDLLNGNLSKKSQLKLVVKIIKSDKFSRESYLNLLKWLSSQKKPSLLCALIIILCLPKFKSKYTYLPEIIKTLMITYLKTVLDRIFLS